MNGEWNILVSLLQIQSSWQRNYWPWELFCKSSRMVTFQTFLLFFSLLVWRGASTQPCPLNDCFVLLLGPHLLAAGHSISFLGWLASFRECVFHYWGRRLFMSHFLVGQSTFLVNNACSLCKGQCQQGDEEVVLFGVLYEHALICVYVLNYGIHNRKPYGRYARLQLGQSSCCCCCFYFFFFKAGSEFSFSRSNSIQFDVDIHSLNITVQFIWLLHVKKLDWLLLF